MAAALKDEGNKLFKAKKYNEAVLRYNHVRVAPSINQSKQDCLLVDQHLNVSLYHIRHLLSAGNCPRMTHKNSRLSSTPMFDITVCVHDVRL